MFYIIPQYWTGLLYLTAFTLSFIVASCYFKTQKNRRAIRVLLFVLAILPLVLIYYLRGTSVGTDFKYYYYLVQRFSEGSVDFSSIWDMREEKGFLLLISFLAWISNYSFYAILFLLDFILLALALYAVNILCRDGEAQFAWLAYLCTFYLQSFNILRQTYATTILLYALFFLLKKKYMLFLLFVFIAALFHRSTLFFIPLGVIIEFKNNFLLKIGTILFLFVVGIRFNIFLSDMGYSNYVAALNKQNAILNLAKNIVLMSPFIYVLLSDNKEDLNIFLIMICVSVSLNLFYFFAPAVYRIILIYNIAVLISISKTIKHNLAIRIYATLYYTFYQFFYLYIINNTCEVWPYVFTY